MARVTTEVFGGPGSVRHHKGYITVLQPTEQSFILGSDREPVVNGGAPPTNGEDNTMVYVGVGLLVAGAAAWWFLR